MKEMRVCNICGTMHPVEELAEFNDNLLCASCLNTETVRCVRCGERIWRDCNEGDHNTPLCQSCYDRYYTTCEDCGRVIHQDDAYYESDDDYEARCYSCHCRHADHGVIHDYYYKPEPDFKGIGSRFFGVELEVDEAGETNVNAAKILDTANSGEERIYIKHDGSLNEGFEIVTHPMGLDYHLKEMPWAAVLDKAKQMGYLSHQAGTCGLHVHINRTAFGETEAEQEEAIARVLYFFEKHWEELLKFSRRTHKQLTQWAARYGLKEHPKDILNHAKGNGERYTCVNLTNYHTVEFKGYSRIKFTTQNTLILINISTFVDKKLVILYNLQHNQKYEERSNFLFRNRSIVRGRMNVERKRPMDNVDRKLICYLAEDANVTTSSLVNKVNLSIPAINKRIAKLKDEGVIEKTTIITDSQKVGKPVMTFVMVALDQFMLSDQLMQIVASDPDILECYAVTGEFDYILKICAKDIDALENKLLHMKQQGIAKSQTLIALREYKFNPSVLPDIALE